MRRRANVGGYELSKIVPTDKNTKNFNGKGVIKLYTLGKLNANFARIITNRMKLDSINDLN